MQIFLKKFGTTLTSRQAGKEAYLALQPLLKGLQQNEKITVDFDGVITFSPSWGDEFLTPLRNNYPHNIELSPSNNPSVMVTLELMKEIWSP